MESKASRLMKNAFFMVFATLFSKALGLVRDMLIAAAYGTGADAIAYDAASRLPILLFDFEKVFKKFTTNEIFNESEGFTFRYEF